MNRGGNVAKGLGVAPFLFHAAFVGADTADATLATSAQYPKRLNVGSTMARASIGLYVVTLAEGTPIIANILPSVVSTSGSGISCTVKTDYSASARTFTVNVWSTGATVQLADPQTTDLMKFTLIGDNSGA